MQLDFPNVISLCAAVRLSETTPRIDLSRVTFFEPFALIYLGMFLRHHNAKGKGFTVKPPTDVRARTYLTKQNFWKRFNFDPSSLDKSLLRQFTSGTSLNDVVDIERRPGIDEEVAMKVRRVVERNRANLDLQLIEEIVAELVSNFARHSQGPLAALAMQWYPRLRLMKLAIGDCGIGIRKSLSSNSKYAGLATRPHDEAARKAFEYGVSCSEGGYGLSIVKDNVREVRGGLILATGNGYVMLRGRAARYGPTSFDLPGVQIEVSIPAGKR